MPTNNIRLFDENKTNMLTDADYRTNAQRLNGVQSGVASSQLQNKTLYQTSLISYAIAQFMNEMGFDASDSGAVSTFVNNLSSSIKKPADSDVKYVSQSLTDEQKMQARWNIAAQNGTFVSEVLNTKGWYRVVTGSDRSGGILTVQNAYNNEGPSSLKLLVTLSDYGGSLKCIEYTNYSVSAITNARIVSNASDQYCIDVYYNVDGANLVAIDFVSTGVREAKVQAPVYIGANDTLQSGENLTATMEYLNPPMQLGVEYRTTERYKGKPVYVKIVDAGVMPSSGVKSVAHGIANIAQIAGFHAQMTTGTDGSGISLPFQRQASYFANAAVSDTNITLWADDNLSIYTHTYCTIKYTKTTD